MKLVELLKYAFDIFMSYKEKDFINVTCVELDLTSLNQLVDNHSFHFCHYDVS